MKIKAPNKPKQVVPEFIKELYSELKELGDTPDKIAKSLYKLNITGVEDSAYFCPIANYIRNKHPYSKITVCQYEISFNGFLCKNKKVVKQFIKNFDEGKYPELDFYNKR